MTIVDRLLKLQEHILEVGLAQAVLALPAPRMLGLPAPSSEGASSANIFVHSITESEIVEVSRDLFVSGHYSLAVQEAYKAVEKAVQAQASEHAKAGTSLMDFVFSVDKPRLAWSDRNTQSEVDEQRGYQRLFSGAMLGIRNPVAHEFDWVESPEVALELLMFAQHLFRKAKQAVPVP